MPNECALKLSARPPASPMRLDRSHGDDADSPPTGSAMEGPSTFETARSRLHTPLAVEEAVTDATDGHPAPNQSSGEAAWVRRGRLPPGGPVDLRCARSRLSCDGCRPSRTRGWLPGLRRRRRARLHLPRQGPRQRVPYRGLRSPGDSTPPPSVPGTTSTRWAGGRWSAAASCWTPSSGRARGAGGQGGRLSAAEPERLVEDYELPVACAAGASCWPLQLRSDAGREVAWLRCPKACWSTMSALGPAFCPPLIIGSASATSGRRLAKVLCGRGRMSGHFLSSDEPDPRGSA